MTVPTSVQAGNPFPDLSPDQRGVLESSAIDPSWAVSAWGVHPSGCDIVFPGFGSPGGMTRYCRACRDAGRAKYQGPPGTAPQPTVLHDAGPGSLVLYTEGVLKSLCAAYLSERYRLPYTVVFINGCDGINAGTKKSHGPQSSGRDVVVVYDADLAVNESVASAALRVEGHLRRAGALSVRFARVPRIAEDPHTGLDDYLSSIVPDKRSVALTTLIQDAPADLLDKESFRARAAAENDAERLSLARRVADRVCSLSLDAVWVQEWRSLLKSECALPHGEFDAIGKDASVRRRTEARETAHAAVKKAGDEMPSPAEPLEVAHALLVRKPAVQERVRVWRGDWYEWTGAHWKLSPVTRITDWLRKDLRHAWYMGGAKEPAPVPWAPTEGKISEVVSALASVLRRPDDAEPDRGLFAANGSVAMDGSVSDPVPEIFNLSSVPYAYDPSAVCPSWEAFLSSSLPLEEDRGLLQEVFGYLLSGDTTQQKIFFLSGPPGSGKGTAMRALQGVLGHESFTSTALPNLGSHFGLASLIGKSVAFLPDVRFNVRGVNEATPTLLSISGEDVLPVARKNRDDWVGMLPTRIVMASNDLPTLPDSSAALYRRLVVVRFGESFTGREDYGLTARLLTELPGILNWSLSGYARLMERGRFLPTSAGDELARAARRESSPEVSFAEDCGTLDPDSFTDSSEIFSAWLSYRSAEGFIKNPSKQGLTRTLASALSGVSAGQKKVAGRKVRGLSGFRLTTSPGQGSLSFDD